MLDTPARIWQRGSEVVVSPPFRCSPFLDALRAHCPDARYDGLGWVVPVADGAYAVNLLRAYFPVIEDRRPNAPSAPPFDDGSVGDACARLDLIPQLAPLAPALHAISDERHEARAALTAIQAQAPDVPAALGFGQAEEGHWVNAYAAQRFWQELLRNFDQVASGNVQPDGSLHETIAPTALIDFWLATRKQVCGPVPERMGQRWHPPQFNAPIWVAALLACVDGPHFTLDPESQLLTRKLPAWPLRRCDPLHRLDLKDAVHWPVSACVLPARQSRDGSDALLHLSAVGGVSKNRALWAAILDGRREHIPLRVGRQRYSPRRIEGRNQYWSNWNDAPLPTSGLSHLALTHRSAFEPALGQDFLHLAGNDLGAAPDLSLFAQQLSRALSLPFELRWGPELWRYGSIADDEDTPLITPLPSVGCQGYWVLADEARWMHLIVALQRGVEPDALGDDDLVITEVGAAARLDEVIEQAGEGDEQNVDDSD